MYRKHIMIKKRKPIMCVQLKKALYGTLQASLLFWKDLSKNLKEWGFEINPYDWCVANKTINGKQCTVLWHVDDIKVSHEDPEVVTRVLEMFEGVYGSKDAPLSNDYERQGARLPGDDNRLSSQRKSQNHYGGVHPSYTGCDPGREWLQRPRPITCST
jgi:hypothetical protein